MSKTHKTVLLLDLDYLFDKSKEYYLESSANKSEITVLESIKANNGTFVPELMIHTDILVLLNHLLRQPNLSIVYYTDMPKEEFENLVIFSETSDPVIVSCGGSILHFDEFPEHSKQQVIVDIPMLAEKLHKKYNADIFKVIDNSYILVKRADLGRARVNITSLLEDPELNKPEILLETNKIFLHIHDKARTEDTAVQRLSEHYEKYYPNTDIIIIGSGSEYDNFSQYSSMHIIPAGSYRAHLSLHCDKSGRATNLITNPGIKGIKEALNLALRFNN